MQTMSINPSFLSRMGVVRQRENLPALPEGWREISTKKKLLLVSECSFKLW